jgi:hypothetical protein
MNKSHLLILGILIFFAGFLVGRTGEKTDIPVAKLTSSAGAPTEAPSEPVSPKKIHPLKTEPQAIFISMPRTEFPGHKELKEFIETNVQAGPVEKYAPSPDGSTVSIQKTDDGGELLRLFKADGSFTGETWKQASGNEIDRDFYKDGSLRGFAFRKLDGSKTLISFLESGRFKSRVDEFSDGSKIVTEFDDSGEVVSRTKLNRDGSSQRISL